MANGKRQRSMTSESVLFSSNPSLNYIKIEKRLLLFATNTNIFTLLFKELKTDGKSFMFVVRPRKVKLNLSIKNVSSGKYTRYVRCFLTVIKYLYINYL